MKPRWHVYHGTDYIKSIRARTYDKAIAAGLYLTRTLGPKVPTIVVPDDERIKRNDR